MGKARKVAVPPEGWHERTYAAEDAIRELGIDAEVWMDYPHVSLRLEAFEELIRMAEGKGKP